MNKRDFYKELMSEYSFDKDKILQNAKKGRLAKQRHLPMYIGMTAAAAAVVVAAGTAITFTLTNKRGAELVEGAALASLSDEQRIEKALDEIRENENSSEMRDVLVTFTSPLSPNAVKNVLTSVTQESVPVKMLYLSDGTRVVGETAVADIFGSGDSPITGAVIRCAGYLMSSLQNEDAVFTVEIITDSDDMEAVAPINTDKIPSSEDNFSDTDISDNDSSATGGYIDNTTETPDSDSDSGSSSETDNSDESDENSDDSSESDEASDSGEFSEDTDSSDSESSGDESPIPVIPPESSGTESISPDRIPEGVTLPAGYEKLSYTTDNLNAQSAFFLNDNIFYVQKEQSISIYGFNGRNEYSIAEVQCEAPNICWVSQNGSAMMVTGCTNGVRDRLYYVNAQREAITEINVRGIVMNGQLESVSYNEGSGLLALCVSEEGSYYVSTEWFDGSSASYNCIVFYSQSEKVSLLGSCGRNLYAACGGKIYRVSAEENSCTEILSPGKNAAFSANLAGTCAAAELSDGKYIFDASSEKLIKVPESGSVSFGAARSWFSVGSNYYEINSGAIYPADGVSVIGKVDFKKSFSSQYQCYASEGSVKITPSSYTAKANTEYLYFGVPAENASAVLRESLNRAIGVQNALALGRCKNSGIDTAEKLNASVKAAFSANAASALRSRCSISESGSLNYSSGGLKAVNISDTTLVISSANENSAEGTLYIRSGTYGGKNGYYSRKVTFSLENGVWKINGIIE